MSPDDLRLTSQSEKFQQLLRHNPRLARRAHRDRSRIALDFSRTEKYAQGYSSPLYADAVVAGYDPEKLLVSYVPPVRPPAPRPSPVLRHVLGGDDSAFFMGPSSGLVTEFDFADGVGNSIGFSLDKSALGLGRTITILLHDLTDDCEIYLGRVGTEPLDVILSHYTEEGMEAVLPSATWTTYGDLIAFTVLHTGTLPFVYGSVSVIW